MKKTLIVILALTAVATSSFAEEQRSFRLAVDAELERSGLIAYLLPRFTLKTGRRAELVARDADVTIGKGDGTVLMARDGRLFYLSLEGGNPAAARFADWVASDIGQTAIVSFVPDNGAPFTAAPKEKIVVEVSFEGDAALGAEVAEEHCARCHRISADAKGMDIGSSPSFPALRALDDWAEKVGAFYALNPHPSFLRVTGVSPPFDPALPPPIVPMELTLAEVEAVQAYMAEIAPADLGAPVAHQ